MLETLSDDDYVNVVHVSIPTANASTLGFHHLQIRERVFYVLNLAQIVVMILYIYSLAGPDIDEC